MEQSSVSRLVGVLFSPTATFKAIEAKPTWALALAVLLVTSLAASVVATDKIDFEELTREQIESSGRTVDEEQIERIVETQEKWGRWISMGTILIGGVIAYLVIALVFWVLLKLLGGEFPYPTAFSTTLHSMMPWAVASLLSIPVVLGREELSNEDLRGGILASNLSLFAPEEASAALVALLASVDLFSLWTLVLLAIGFSVTARVSLKASSFAVVGVWIVYVLGKVGLAAAFN